MKNPFSKHIQSNMIGSSSSV